MPEKAIAITSEKKLLISSARGEEEAFAQLFHFYKDKLFSFIFRITGSPQLAEDIIQEVFAKIWTKKEQLIDVDNFGSYLFRAAQNHSINAFRKMAAENLAVSALKNRLEDNSTDHYMSEKETTALLHTALSRLSAQQKLVFTLSREEGLRYEEIAKKLNLSPSTVKNHMIAALRTLRETFKASPDMVGYLLLFLSILSAVEK